MAYVRVAGQVERIDEHLHRLGAGFDAGGVTGVEQLHQAFEVVVFGAQALERRRHHSSVRSRVARIVSIASVECA